MGNLKAKGQDKKGGSFNKLNAATRRAIYSLCILVGLFVLFSILQPAKFLAPANLQNLLQQIVTYTIIGCGLTFCLVCGGNDLSAGASMALSGIIMVSLLMQGLPLVVCIALCLVMGIMTGIMNGFFYRNSGCCALCCNFGNPVGIPGHGKRAGKRCASVYHQHSF